MNRNLKNTVLGTLAGIVLVVLLLMILPISVVYQVPVDTKVYPAKQWKLLQSEGDFHTEELDYTGSNNSRIKTFLFDRGDVVDIDFNTGALKNSYINKDSILLSFSSMMHNLRIQRALNEIRIQESEVKAGLASLKRPLVLEAKENIKLAQSNVKLQQINFDRLQQLVLDGVISQSELDSQLNRLEVAEQELEIAKQRLASSSFDQRPEEIAVIDTKINSMDKELDILLAQQGSYSIRSPFDGSVKIQPEEGVLISLTDTSTLTFLFPFPIEQRDNINQYSVLRVETKDGNIDLPFSLKDDVQNIRGTQACLGVANFTDQDFQIGQLVSANLVCDTVTMRSYLLRKFN